MNPLRLLRLALTLHLWSGFLAHMQAQAPGALDPYLNVYGSNVRAIAVQPDGKTLIGGLFSEVGAAYRRNIARLNADGSVDNGFSAYTDQYDGHGDVYCLAVQADAKVLLGGDFDTVSFADRRYLARINADGTIDSVFSPYLDHAVRGMAVQPDGKVIVGGFFNYVNGVARNGVARFNADGTLDTAFNPNVLGAVLGVALQPDGKVLIGGYFTSVGGVTRNRIARLNADGTLDAGFNPNADSGVYSVMVQPDGKIIIGGDFNILGSTTRPGIGRLNADGTLDAAFVPDGRAYTIALQADGKMLVGGYGAVRRFNADGTLDDGFNATVNSDVYSVALQPDGRVIIGGDFNRVNDTARQRLARLTNGAASQNLSVTSTHRVEWLRGGTAPEVGQVIFEVSSDGGASWISLGAATRIVGGWERTGLSLPPAGMVRVRGRTSGGYLNGSSGLIETVTAFNLFALLAPTSGTSSNSPVNVSFHLPETALAGSISLTFDDGTIPRVLTLGASQETADEHSFTFHPANPVSSSGGAVLWGAAIPDGTYTVTLSYQNAAGNPAAASSTNVIIDTVAPTLSAPDGGFTPALLHVPQDGMVALPDYTGQAVVDDGLSVIVQEPAAGTLVGEGVVRGVGLTATDLAGNTSTVSFDVAVLVSGAAVLAMKGGAVPNEAGIDPRIPAGATWGTFGVPSISMNGTKAGWLATVLTPPKGSFAGIFTGPILAPTLRLKTGDAVPGATGATFKSFREPVFAGDNFAVTATLNGAGKASDTGVWANETGTLHEVAREGVVAPGADGAKFKAFPSIAMPAPGVVFFTAKLAAPSAKDMGLWTWTAATGTVLALREGSMVDVGAGPAPLKTFLALTSVNGSSGHGRYAADSAALDVLLKLADDRTALATVAPNGSVNVTRVSGDAEATGLFTLAGFGVPSSPGGGLGASALATLNANLNVSAKNNDVVFDDHDARVRAREVGFAHGAGLGLFKRFGDPVAGYDFANRRVQTFAATLTGVPRSGDMGVWAFTNALALVARESAEPPGAVRTKWKSFTSLSVLGGRGPMFTAKLASGTAKVTPKNDAGLWAMDSTGALRLIFREGQEVAPGKALRSFDVLGAVAGSPGQRRAWTSGDASARVIYRAFFTDGTSAIMSTAVP